MSLKSDRDAFELRVRSYELDSYAHVNNGAYVGWFEDGRERLLLTRERDYGWYKDQMTWFVVAALSLEYLAQGRPHDDVRVESRFAAFGRTSVTYRQVARRLGAGVVLARARVVMAFADAAGRSTPIPADFRDRFNISAAGDHWTADEGGERA